MNYKRIYSEIILNRVNNPLPEDVYGQKHHILPKSLYPQYEKTKDAMKRPEVYAKIKKRKVVCIETGIVYNSIKEACQMAKISSIGACCKRKIKHAGGYHWKYVDEVNDEEK